MVKGKIHVVRYKRKRLGKTNYRKRLKLLLSGKDRLVVRFSTNNVTAQIVSYSPKGDLVKLGVKSSSLSKHGWTFGSKNIPAAYLTGLLLANQAKGKNYSGELVLDTGFTTLQKQGRLFAVLRGVIDGGLPVRVGDESIFPKAEVFSGEKIAAYATKLKGESEEKYSKQFSKYISNGVDPTKMPETFSKVKETLLA
ncbi:50S ribosomal protein L18 [archaeon]|jgi:large subunit ribosomal protein L18|nr:50S ribosomal protein L18 [archaeon]MBT6761744.1 50S ribosomal protein L18 [archaeon]